MTDAPERIHVRWGKAGGVRVTYMEEQFWPPDNNAEYIRADLVEARIAELEAALDSIEIEHGITSNGNLWRFWSQKCHDLITKQKARIAAAEAAMAERAASLVPDKKWWQGGEVAVGLDLLTHAIRALITPDAQSALDQVIAEAVRREREACAKVTEGWIGSEAIAAAIRERGE